MNAKHTYAQVGTLLDEEGLQFFIQKANEEIVAHRALYESKLPDFTELETMYLSEKAIMDGIVAGIHKKKAWLENVERIQEMKKAKGVKPETVMVGGDNALTNGGRKTAASPRIDWLGLCVEVLKDAKKFLSAEQVYNRLLDTNEEMNARNKSLPIWQQNAQAKTVINRLTGAAANENESVPNASIRQLIGWNGLIGLKDWMQGSEPLPAYYGGAVKPEASKVASDAPALRPRTLKIGRKERVLA